MRTDYFDLAVQSARSTFAFARWGPTHRSVDEGRLGFRLAACGREVLAVEVDNATPNCPDCHEARAAVAALEGRR